MYINPFFLRTRLLEFIKYGFDLSWFIAGIYLLITSFGAVTMISVVAAYSVLTVVVHIYEEALASLAENEDE